MEIKDFEKLVKEYGPIKAGQALDWFSQFSPEFRRAVKAFKYCKDNEFLWF